MSQFFIKQLFNCTLCPLGLLQVHTTKIVSVFRSKKVNLGCDVTMGTWNIDNTNHSLYYLCLEVRNTNHYSNQEIKMSYKKKNKA